MVYPSFSATALAARPLVATVLPPGEGFSPEAVGAVGLLVHRLTVALACDDAVVVGAPQRHATFRDVRFLPAPIPVLAFGGRNRRYAAGVARVLRPLMPSLIEVHNKPDVALALAEQFPGVPVTLTLHNDPVTMRGADTPAARRMLLERLAQVITVSRFLKERLLLGNTPPPDRAPVVLHNCIDLEAIPPPVPAREDVILFAGRIVADKGADSFVAACAHVLPLLPGWRAEMIGADRFRPDSPDTPFIQRLRPRLVAAKVSLRGYRPHADVLRAMRRAAIVVVPSRFDEPFGMTALEAMACGAPLVCTERGALPEVAGAAAMFVDPDDSGSIAEAILILARDRTRRETLSEAGLARAKTFAAPEAAAALQALRAAHMAVIAPPSYMEASTALMQD